jgi:hypothetical protein
MWFFVFLGEVLQDTVGILLIVIYDLAEVAAKVWELTVKPYPYGEQGYEV